MMECSDSEIKRMYDTVFDGIKAPEKLYKKVMDISHTKKRSMNGMKKTAIVLVMVLLCSCSKQPSWWNKDQIDTISSIKQLNKEIEI